MIDIRQMRYFVTLAQTLHFRRAAEQLHISQPPLSRQIAALEQELGVALIERHSRQARLTHAGQRFLEDAKAVLAAFDQACRNAKLVEAGELGELRVGFMMHAAYSSVPPLARQFVSAYPQVRLQLREAIPGELVDRVIDGDFDAAICFRPPPSRVLAVHPVHREPLCVVVPSGHRLADAASVGIADIADEPLITVPAQVAPTLRQAAENYYLQAGLRPLVRFEVQLQQSIVSLVGESLGIALVPVSLRSVAPQAVAFVPLAQAPEVEHVLCWRPSNINPALARFLQTSGVPSA